MGLISKIYTIKIFSQICFMDVGEFMDPQNDYIRETKYSNNNIVMTRKILEFIYSNNKNKSKKYILVIILPYVLTNYKNILLL